MFLCGLLVSLSEISEVISFWILFASSVSLLSGFVSSCMTVSFSAFSFSCWDSYSSEYIEDGVFSLVVCFGDILVGDFWDWSPFCFLVGGSDFLSWVPSVSMVSITYSRESLCFGFLGLSSLELCTFSALSPSLNCALCVLFLLSFLRF